METQSTTPSFVNDSKIKLSDNSRQVLEKRYLRRGPAGKPVETIPEMFWRVAWHIAAPEAEYNGDVENIARAFYELLTSLRFLPNSPAFTGAGTPLGQLAGCFVLPIEDDMGREPGGIFQTLRDAALIQQTGGGVGFSFSRLRPKGDFVYTSGGTATGPVGFLQVYDTAFGEISQGGTRRGANMAVLRVDHPDIEDLIQCKSEEGEITNFNISAGITDAFMQAVENDEDFDLVNPRDGKVWRTVRARTLFDLIARYAHKNGEPGVLFIDTANRQNPLPHLCKLEATNPCGEQWLCPYENCCLGSINLTQHVTEDNRVDWEKLRESVELATLFLDSVVTVNAYVPAVPQLKEAALRARRIGLGIMGLADMMYRLGVRYGSEEAPEFAAQVMEFIRFHCMHTSIEMARERGPFLAIKGSIYDPEELKWTLPRPLTPYTRLERWDRPPLDWDEIVAGIRQHGIRNAAQTTVAPTGTVSTVAGCEGYGCEPVFALAYTRHFKDGDRDVPLPYVSPLFERALSNAGLDEATRQRIYDQVLQVGTCQHIAELPERIRHTFVVSQDITAEEHVRMQAAIQAFVDNSISKTCNFPPDATVEDVETAYLLAWKLGCKGLTVYVTGSREKVVLETGERQAGTAELPTRLQAGPLPPLKQERAPVLMGLTFKKETPVGTAYVAVNCPEDAPHMPLEVFVTVGKAGSEVTAVSEALGRLISLCLRLTSPRSSRDRAIEIVNELYGIGGGRELGFGLNRVRSLPDGIAQALMKYLERTPVEGESEALPGQVPKAQLPLQIESGRQHDSELSIGDLCPECGQASVVLVEGCRTCVWCGYTTC